MKRKLVFKELVVNNKREIEKDIKTLERIDRKIENTFVKKS